MQGLLAASSTSSPAEHGAIVNHDNGHPETYAGGFLHRTFTAIVARSRLVIAIYAVLLVPSVWYAVRVGQDNSIDRLIVATDPDAIATREFETVFGSGEYAILLAEAD